MKKTIFFAALLLIASCSNPMNKKYDEKTIEQDMKTIYEDKKISEEDKKSLAGWIVLAKIGNKDLTGKTYQQILDEVKNHNKEQEELKAKAIAEEKARSEKMKNAVTISILSTDYQHEDFENFNVFNYAIQNKANKPIKAIKFSFKIYDSLGDEIGNQKGVSVTDQTIAALGTYKGSAFYHYNQYMDEDVSIKNSKFENLTFDINIEKIVYTDDTNLE